MSVWARQAEGDVEDVAAYATRAVERELLNFWRGHRRRAWSWSDGVDLHDVAADESEDDWLGAAAARAWLAEVLSLPPHEHGLSSCQVQILSLLLGGGSHTIASIARHVGCERHRVRSQLRSAVVKLRNLRENWSPPVSMEMGPLAQSRRWGTKVPKRLAGTHGDTSSEAYPA